MSDAEKVVKLTLREELTVLDRYGYLLDRLGRLDTKTDSFRRALDEFLESAEHSGEQDRMNVLEESVWKLAVTLRFQATLAKKHKPEA